MRERERESNVRFCKQLSGSYSKRLCRRCASRFAIMNISTKSVPFRCASLPLFIGARSTRYVRRKLRNNSFRNTADVICVRSVLETQHWRCSFLLMDCYLLLPISTWSFVFCIVFYYSTVATMLDFCLLEFRICKTVCTSCWNYFEVTFCLSSPCPLFHLSDKSKERNDEMCESNWFIVAVL